METVKGFLNGKTILITGATGFLGQPLVEKILFAAPDVKRIYVLIRAREQWGGRILPAQERLERELYQSSVFDRLRGVHGEAIEVFLKDKLVAVAGDISEDNLGLNPEDENTLKADIDILINSAAVVSFDAPLDQALELNVLSARRLAQFSMSCENCLLVHVSTAYVSGAVRRHARETAYHQRAEENEGFFPRGQFTDVNRDIAEVQRILREIQEEAHSERVERELKILVLKRSRKGKKVKGNRWRERVETLRRRWWQNHLVEKGMEWARHRGWNDTYTYTKAMGEQVVIAARGDTPTVILRPSIIESSLSEPCPGWLDGLRMADPLIAAIGKGRLKSLPLNPEVMIDLVPVDVVVNALLASIPEAHRQGGLHIYQVATGSRNPIALGELYKLVYEYFRQHPMLDKKGRPRRIRPLRFPKRTTFRLQHRLKAVPLGTAERTLERLSVFESTQKVKRRISATRAAHQKLYYYGEIYEPYLNLNCQFDVENTVRLYNGLSSDERKEFNFDVTRINWRHYIQNVHIPGVKKFILKMEGAGTMELEEEASKLPVSTIKELVEYSAARFGNKTALQIKRGGLFVRFTYEDLRKQAERMARRFQRLGYKKGDRVVLFSENQPEWGIAYLGAMFAGLVVVPLDSQSWHLEVWSVARFTEARAILASENCFQRLTPESLRENEQVPHPVALLNVNRFCRPFKRPEYPLSTSPVETESGQRQAVEIEPDDPTSIIFTTGTVADPKGAVHTHRNFLNNLFGVNHYLPVQPSDMFLSVLPLYHALEFTCGFLMAIFGGATVTYAQTLKPRGILETIRETGTTCMLGVPTFYSLLRDDIERRVLKSSKSGFKSNLMTTSKQLSRSLERRLRRNVGRRLFARVHQEFGGKIRILVSGGSELGEELYEDFKALGMPIYEGYGLTETAPVLTVSPQNLSRPRSAGKPLPGVEIRLDHPDADGVGEIVVRSPSLMLGYYKNPEATRRVVKDGWLYTGDLGWVDLDGYIYITGRSKDVIVTGAGKNVYPSDLEAIYNRLEAISQIAVVGLKSGLTEEVHAAIEPSPDVFQDVAREEVRKQVQLEIRKLGRELPGYHRLQQIHLWQEGIPRHEDGSFDRRAIRQRILRQPEGERGPEVHRGTREERDGRRETLLREISRLSGTPSDEIDEQSHLYEDLGLDSLMAIELLLFAEHEFGITLPDDRTARLQKVGHLLQELEKFEGAAEGRRRKEASADEPMLFSALPLDRRPRLDRLLLKLSFGGLRAFYRFYFGLKAADAGHIPKGGAYIIAANHSSHLDTGAIVSAVGRGLGKEEACRLHVLGARDYFFGSPVKSWLVSRLLNVVPIERKEASLASLRVVKSILQRGEPVLIFPEGTRSRSGELQEFKPGLGLMAWESQTPIIPAHIEGTYDALPPGKAFPRPKSVRVTFGPPVQMEEYRADGESPPRDDLYRRIASDVHAIVNLLGNSR